MPRRQSSSLLHPPKRRHRHKKVDIKRCATLGPCCHLLHRCHRPSAHGTRRLPSRTGRRSLRCLLSHSADLSHGVSVSLHSSSSYRLPLPTDLPSSSRTCATPRAPPPPAASRSGTPCRRPSISTCARRHSPSPLLDCRYQTTSAPKCSPRPSSSASSAAAPPLQSTSAQRRLSASHRRCATTAAPRLSIWSSRCLPIVNTPCRARRLRAATFQYSPSPRGSLRIGRAATLSTWSSRESSCPLGRALSA